MTTYDFQAFCVLCLAAIAALLLIWYQWSWWIVMAGNIIAVSMNLLLVLAVLALVIFGMAWLYYSLALKQAQIEGERAKADRERARADHERAKAIAATQYIVPIKAGNGIFTNQPLTALHVPPALPQPQEPAQLLPPQNIIPHDVWFPKAANALHLITIGESGSGKTTLIKALVNASTALGQVLALDPHGRAKDWPGLVIVGNGRNYEAIEQAMKGALEELSRRYKAYDQGQDDFKRLTFIVDETTAIAEKCKSWPVFFKDISCEGRKVNMRLIVLIHGKGVKTLNLEGQGDLRNNLIFIYLGKHATDQMKESSQLDRPAVMEIDGVNRLIDTSKILELATPQKPLTPILPDENTPLVSENAQLTDRVGNTPPINHEAILSTLENDKERVIASLLLVGMHDPAIAKHLGGKYETNLDRVTQVRAKLNGRLAVRNVQ